MILALDTFYTDNEALTVGALFNVGDSVPQKLLTDIKGGIEPYESGKFYLRELPCIIQFLNKIRLDQIDVIIIDGYVYINDDKVNGLGGYLWEHLNEDFPIIGVAKNKLHHTSNVAIPLLRGKSEKPLFISAAGISLEKAVSLIEKMHGHHRMPTILKLVDKETRSKVQNVPS